MDTIATWGSAEENSAKQNRFLICSLGHEEHTGQMDTPQNCLFALTFAVLFYSLVEIPYPQTRQRLYAFAKNACDGVVRVLGEGDEPHIGVVGGVARQTTLFAILI